MTLRCRATRIEFCWTGLVLVVLGVTQWAVQRNSRRVRVYDGSTRWSTHRKRWRDPPPPDDEEAPLAIWLGGRGVGVPGCAADCYAQPNADLGGQPLVAGPQNQMDSASACCESCRAHRNRSAAERGCNVWVWCADAGGCGASYHHCWLKWQPVPMALPGVSGLGRQVPWVSGVWGDAEALAAARRTATRPLPSVAAGAELALSTHLGAVRLRLNVKGSPKAVAWLRGLARAPHRCHGCCFYRAEPVPPRWGLHASYGPPYALLQGSFRADGARGTDAAPHLVQEEGCVLRRGMLIIIGQGPDFLIGLAHHPEWSPSYTYVADVVAEDLVVVDAIMGQRLREENWGSIVATVPVRPVAFNLTEL